MEQGSGSNQGHSVYHVAVERITTLGWIRLDASYVLHVRSSDRVHQCGELGLELGGNSVSLQETLAGILLRTVYPALYVESEDLQEELVGGGQHQLLQLGWNRVSVPIHEPAGAIMVCTVKRGSIEIMCHAVRTRKGKGKGET